MLVLYPCIEADVHMFSVKITGGEVWMYVLSTQIFDFYIQMYNPQSIWSYL